MMVIGTRIQKGLGQTVTDSSVETFAIDGQGIVFYG
jgi:hypothetical protein